MEKRESSVQKYFDGIAAIIAVIIVIGFVRIAYLYFGSNQEAFDWCDSAAQLFGKCLHWGICILFCAESVIFLRRIRERRRKFLSIQFGVGLFFEGLLLEILGRTYDDWTNTDRSIVLFRVFGLTYSNMAGFTMFMGALLIICGIVVFMKEKRNF